MKYTSLSDPHVNAFILQHAKETFYYSQAWLDIITKLYGYSTTLLTTTNTAGQVTGILPVCYMQNPLVGRRLVALPFSDYCPILAVDDISANRLIDQAVYLAQQQDVKYLELRAGANDVLAKRSDFMAGNLYVRWLMPLAPDPDTIWSGLRKPVQKRIKRARRMGVEVRIAQHREDLAHYYRLHLLTRSGKHGMPPQPRRFFFELWDAFAECGTLQLLLAEHKGIVIAAMILLASGTTVRCAYSASDEQYLNLAPNNLLFWSAIAWGCAQGYQTVDFGRTACDNQGLMTFKQRWGAIKQPLPYYYYPQMAGLAATSENSWKFRLFTTCWKRLPLQVAEHLGGHIYRHLG